MIDPVDAPLREDLTFLQRRSRPRVVAPAAVPHAGASSAKPVDYTHHASAKSASTPGAAAAPPATSAPASRTVIDFSRPNRVAAQVVPAAPQPSTPSAGVNFGRERTSSTGSLDLSDPPVPAGARRPAPEPLPRYRGPRVAAGQQLLLGTDTPAATLTRVQSGVGRLTVQAICSPEIGDLRLGALYQLRSGGTSTVQLAGGNRFAPSSRRPVIIASREEYEQLAFDLRQIRDVERVSVYAFSESRTPLTWGGTLVITTFGGARIELPLEKLPPASIAVLVSFYNVSGELVVRTEFETIAGDVREAARAYGYDRITWRDDRTPVD